MNAVADAVSDRRADAVRWVVCFVLVVAAHGVGAMALMNDSSEVSDFGVIAPVVVVDLAESLALRNAPNSDLPPGPLQEEQTELMPPKEETKPPEPEAEVTIPIPEPPKVEEQFEVKQATAPAPAIAPQVVVMHWKNRLMARIEGFKGYPDEANGRLGSAMVTFTIDREGHLLESRIIKSTGSAPLDNEALAMLVRAQPLPKPPDHIPDADLVIIFQMNFNPPKPRK